MRRLALAALFATMSVAAPAQITADSSFRAGMNAYWSDSLAAALPLLRDAASSKDPNIANQLMYAETARRQQLFSVADSVARVALARSTCNAIAHGTLASLYDDQYSSWPGANAESSWVHVNAAVRCDENDGNAWVTMYIQASARDDSALSDKALRRLLETKFFSPPYIALARWLLTTAPPHALVFTAGDLDFIPARALQRIEGVRPDLLVVNTSLLQLPWYTARLHTRDSMPLPVPADSLVYYLDGIPGVAPDLAGLVVQSLRHAAATGTLGRPLVYAFTSGEIKPSARLGGITLMGASQLVSDFAKASAIDTAAVRRSLETVHGAEWRGPSTSLQDRSPVRTASALPAAFFPMYVACVLSAAWLGAGRHAEARAWRVWADSVFKAADLKDGNSVETIKWIRSIASDSALSVTP
jgi:hypothetical protein